MSILFVGVASSLVLATKALPDGDRLTCRLLDDSQIAQEFIEELQDALHFTERTATAISFTVADRDRDGIPERIRYAWSGTSGDSLTRQYNSGEAVAVLDTVEEFALGYDLAAVTETYPGPEIESCELTLSHFNPSSYLGDYSARNNRKYGQYFAPSLASDVTSWRVTRAYVSLRADGYISGPIDVRLTLPANNKWPTENVVDSASVEESQLSYSFNWREFQFPEARGLSPDLGLCLTVTTNAGGTPGRFRYGSGISVGDEGLVRGQPDWSETKSDRQMLHYVYGTTSTAGEPQTVIRQYVTGVQLTLRSGSDMRGRIDSAVRLMNTPEVLSGLWELSAGDNPTLDRNGDGAPDWVFDTASNEAAQKGTLATSPGHDFLQPITAEVRFRHLDPGGDGATIQINADYSAGTYAPFLATLKLESGGYSQILSVYGFDSGGAKKRLMLVSGLPASVVGLRLLVDPARNTVNIRVNDEDRGTYGYDPICAPACDGASTISTWGGDTEFEFVSIRVGGTGS